MNFRLLLPETEDELQRYLMEDETRVLAGGTDLLVQMRAGRLHPGRIASIKNLDGLRSISDLGDRVRVGAGVTYSQFSNYSRLSGRCQIVEKAVRRIGSVQIRNRGTLVGNVTNASPAGDAVLALVLSNAVVEIAGPKGERHDPIEAFILGPGKTTLSSGEYVRAIVFEKTDNWTPFFMKVGQRNAMCIAVASVGALVKESNLRIAFGSVAPVVVRAHKAERFFSREGIDGTKLDEFVDRCMESIAPIDDVRASSWYRRQVVRGVLKRLFGHPESGGMHVT